MLPKETLFVVSEENQSSELANQLLKEAESLSYKKSDDHSREWKCPEIDTKQKLHVLSY